MNITCGLFTPAWALPPLAPPYKGGEIGGDSKEEECPYRNDEMYYLIMDSLIDRNMTPGGVHE